MTKYETWSLILTGIYDVLTFLLLVFTVYATVLHRRRPNFAFFPRGVHRETKTWSWRLRSIGFVLENRGVELRNLKITSTPDDLGWGNLPSSSPPLEPLKTSEYFDQEIPVLGENVTQTFFWCDAEANKQVMEKPFKLLVEFDNPVFIFPRRLKREFSFDFSNLKNVVEGLNHRFDIHNVALELARIRGDLETLNKTVVKVSRLK